MGTERYDTNHGTAYEPPGHRGYNTIAVLTFLWGEPWDDRALDFIHALRPSSIRVGTPSRCMTCDMTMWRVTVMVDETKTTIKKIEQEVEVGLRTADNAHCLDHKIPRGSWSKEGGISIVNARAVKKLKDLGEGQKT